MEQTYYGIPHNHPIIEPVGGLLYHNDYDPRKLESSCPACKALMSDWQAKVNQMMSEGV